jgi:23S rRNA pseudouridine1911/1915/1917 synthase
VKAGEFAIGASESGRTLAAIVKTRQQLSWSKSRALIEARRVKLNGAICCEPERRVYLGQLVQLLDAAERRHFVRSKTAASHRKRKAASEHGIVVVHCDDDIVVVEKPSGLTTMRHASEAAEFGPRGKHYLPRTVADHLRSVLSIRELRAVHRLDRDTSGLVVFARTADAERHLGRQFRAHTVARKYLAIVRGHPADGRIESSLVRDRGDGRRGSGASGAGQHAVTHVRTVEPLGPCTLVECRLETGRTHQVRIHLGESGTPLAGETIYDRPLHGAPVPDPSGAPRLALHAASLGFEHPKTGRWMEWHSELPADLAFVVERLRGLLGSET